MKAALSLTAVPLLASLGSALPQPHAGNKRANVSSWNPPSDLVTPLKEVSRFPSVLPYPYPRR